MFDAIFSVNDEEFFGQVFLNFHDYRWHKKDDEQTVRNNADTSVLQQ